MISLQGARTSRGKACDFFFPTPASLVDSDELLMFDLVYGALIWERC